MPKVSVIVPCYNEEENIQQFYNCMMDNFRQTDYLLEIIFVNDGSSDNTSAEIKKCMALKECEIKLISFSRNFGKESAMYAGFTHADGDYTVIIDADMQQNPGLILDMLKVVEEEPEYDGVVFYQESRKEPAIMKFFKKRFYNVMNRISDVEFVQGASDFRLFSKPMKEAILEISETSRFSKGIFSWIGFNNKYIPYTPEKRVAGESKWNYFKLFKYALSGITSFSDAPLKIASSLGTAIAGVSFIYLFVVIIQKLFLGISVPGYPTIVGLILFLGGIQLICIGINSQYLSKTFLETKHRPIYIAKEIIESEKQEPADMRKDTPQNVSELKSDSKQGGERRGTSELKSDSKQGGERRGTSDLKSDSKQSVERRGTSDLKIESEK